MDKVSIIIPVFNAEQYICRCLDSLKNQTYSNIEIIVVDDGSTDDSAKYIADKKREDNRILVFSQKNSGPSAARNLGLSKMSGSYFTFLDADDVLLENAISTMVACAQSYDADYCVFGIKTPGRGEGDKLSVDKVLRLERAAYLNLILCEDYKCGGGFPFAKLWRVSDKSARCMKKFDESIKIYEDKLFVLENAKNLESVMAFPDRVYEYYIRQDSLSHSKSTEKIKNTIIGIERLMDSLSSECSSEAMEITKENHLRQICLYVYYTKGKCEREYLSEFNRNWKSLIRSNRVGVRTKLRCLTAHLLYNYK